MKGLLRPLSVAAPLALLLACQTPSSTPVRIVPQVGPVQPRFVAFSPADEGKLLVLEFSGRVGVWDVSAPAGPVLFASIPAAALAAAFTPDGRAIVTVGFDGRLRRWTPDGQLSWVSKDGHGAAARALAVGSDLIVTGGDDDLVRVWHSDGSPAGAPLTAHDAEVVSVDLAPSGEIVSEAGDGSVRMWTRGANNVYSAATLFQQAEPPTKQFFSNLLRHDVNWRWHHSVAFAPNGGMIAVAVLDGALRVFDRDGKTRVEILQAHAGQHLRTVAFAPAGDVIASAGFDGSLRLWNLDGSPRGNVQAHTGSAFSVSFAADGKHLATAGADNRVRLWNIDGTKLAELPVGLRERITAVAMASNAPKLAVAGVDRVSVWDLDGRLRGATAAAQMGKIASLAVTADGERFATGGLGVVKLWSADGTPRGSPLTGGVDMVRGLAFAPDGHDLAAGGDTLHLLGADGVLWRQEPFEPDSVTRVAFAPGGQVIAIGSELGRLQVSNRDGVPRTPALKLGREYIRGLAFVRNGDMFATAGGEENVVRLWTLDVTPAAAPLEGHVGVVDVLASTPDTEILASGSEDGTVRLWRLPAREAKVITVGLPVDQLGFSGELLWVRAADDSIFLYGRDDHRLRATVLLRRQGPLIYTPDGWYAGEPGPAKIFDQSGAILADAEVTKRQAPERVLAVLTDR